MIFIFSLGSTEVNGLVMGHSRMGYNRMELGHNTTILNQEKKKMMIQFQLPFPRLCR
jgi:hypothetical protein